MVSCAAGDKCHCPRLNLFGKHPCADCGRELHAICAFEDVDAPLGKGDVCPDCQERRDAITNMIKETHRSKETVSKEKNTKLAAKECFPAKGAHMEQKGKNAKKRSTKVTAPATKAKQRKTNPPQSKKPPPPPVAAKKSAPAAAQPEKKSQFHGRQLKRSGCEPCTLFVQGEDILEVHPSLSENKEKGEIWSPKDNRTSAVWKAFHVGQDMAYCNKCGDQFSVKGSANSTLWRHLETEHAFVYAHLNAIRLGKAEDKKSIVTQRLDTIKGQSPGDSAASTATKGLTQGQLQFQPWDSSKRKPTKSEIEVHASQRVLDMQALVAAKMNRPYSDFDNEAMKNLLEAVAEAGKVGAKFSWCSKSTKTRVSELAQGCRRDLTQRLKGKTVTTTTDHWTSRANRNYASLTVHWIEDFVLHHCVLSIHVYEGSTASPFLVEDFLKTLAEYEIEPGTVPFVVTDTEAKMNKFGILLEDHNIEHIYCLDHLLQLVALEAFDGILSTNDEAQDENNYGGGSEDAIPGLTSDNILKKARRLVAFFSRSTQAADHLREIQSQFPGGTGPPLDLIGDVVTRWWSSSDMIERLKALRKALVWYGMTYPFPKPTGNQLAVELLEPDEWVALEKLSRLLKPLKQAQKLLEGQKYVTSSLVPFIVYAITAELQNTSEYDDANSSLRDIAVRMGDKMHEIFGSPEEMFSEVTVRGHGNRQVGLNKALIFAHALDPRFKRLGILSGETQKAAWASLEEELVSLGPHEETTPAADDEEVILPVPAAAAPSSPCFLSRYANILTNPQTSASSTSSQTTSEWQSKCHLEIEVYKTLAHVDFLDHHKNFNKNFDPLQWWKAGIHLQLPNLWRLAMIYLAIPATSAPSERAFSVAGNIVTMRRCRLGNAALEDLHHLHENF